MIKKIGKRKKSWQSWIGKIERYDPGINQSVPPTQIQDLPILQDREAANRVLSEVGDKGWQNLQMRRLPGGSR